MIRVASNLFQGTIVGFVQEEEDTPYEKCNIDKVSVDRCIPAVRRVSV